MESGESFYKRILDNLSEGVYFLDKNRTITYWNRGAERITGYRSADVLGSNCRDDILVHVDEKGKSLCESGCPVAETLLDSANREAKVFLHHRDGHRVPVLVRVSPILDERGRTIGAVEVFRENGADAASEQYIEDLKKAALLDPLTGLSNRRFLDARLTACQEDFNRHGFPFAAVFADIDHFKNVNDTYGHPAGDEVLKMVAATLKASVRISDTAGRWGGEEFLLILQHLRDEELGSIADKLRTLVEQSFLQTDQGALRVTISMGASMYRQGEPIQSLLERADGLLYEAKAAGRNRVICSP